MVQLRRESSCSYLGRSDLRSRLQFIAVITRRRLVNSLQARWRLAGQRRANKAGNSMEVISAIIRNYAGDMSEVSQGRSSQTPLCNGGDKTKGRTLIEKEEVCLIWKHHALRPEKMLASIATRTQSLVKTC